MKFTRLCMLALLIVTLSAAAAYAQGFSIVKDPWNILETNTGFGRTVQRLSDIYGVANNHYKYAMFRDQWTSPLKIADELSRLAAVNVKTHETGWGTGGVFEQKLPNIARDLDGIQQTIDSGTGAGALRAEYADIYGDPTAGSVDRAYRDMASATAQAGRTNKAIQENLDNAKKTKDKLENCDKCTQSDKDRLTTELNYYSIMAQQYQAQSGNNNTLLAADQAGIQAAKVNEENQNRWHERDAAAAMVKVTRVGVGPLVSQSRQD